MEYNKSLKGMREKYSPYNSGRIKKRLSELLNQSDTKIVVLDDDPTGVQTVHDIYVYTDWSQESIEQGFNDKRKMFFLLTNSRSFTAEKTKSIHGDIAKRVIAVAKDKRSSFLIISRGDSTLRGHYPLETETLREIIENESGMTLNGEIIIPFFPEGGRYTDDNVHYVADGDILVPAGQTEFARDKTFGYKNSNLCEWVQEKTGGSFLSKDVLSIPVDQLRAEDYDGIYRKLIAARNFTKIVVNALDYNDLEVFAIALLMALKKGGRYLFRTASAFVKVIGGVNDKPCLNHDELIDEKNKNGGIVIIGSHVKKTSRQLEYLHENCVDKDMKFIEFNQHLVLDDAAFESELNRVIKLVENNIASGISVVVFTKRDRFDLNTGNKEDELRIAIKISNALTGIIKGVKVRPNFIVAKGGITSSDIGTKGLGVKKALVMGQILKGIPVWRTGKESLFPDMPYVIFPGNVGNDDTLYEVITILKQRKNVYEGGIL
jgi:uncharacterized protein YgbK (DUF1537 family)